jgi:hypothetical protein
MSNIHSGGGPSGLFPSEVRSIIKSGGGPSGLRGLTRLVALFITLARLLGSILGRLLGSILGSILGRLLTVTPEGGPFLRPSAGGGGGGGTRNKGCLHRGHLQSK